MKELFKEYGMDYQAFINKEANVAMKDFILPNMAKTAYSRIEFTNLDIMMHVSSYLYVDDVIDEICKRFRAIGYEVNWKPMEDRYVVLVVEK